jgi:UDP-N-acetylglucosamine 2-epimerase (non-hydrolysing)
MGIEAGLFVGTRPSLIMAAPIVRAIDAAGIDLQLVHTGQHYSDNMDKIFFEELMLREPDVRFARSEGSAGPARQIADILVGAEDWLISEKPKIVLALGDTNSNFAAAVAACKHGVPVWHIEAGERAFDMASPEEQNRVMIDHISVLNLCTNEKSRKNLLQEGIDQSRIAVVGNPIVDSLIKNLDRAENAGFDDPELLACIDAPFWIMTLHRQETVDDKTLLAAVLAGLADQARKHGCRIIFPMHPRTFSNAKKFGLLTKLTEMPEFLIKPGLGYLQFISLLRRAEICLTDSGGVQQEAAILSIPTVTVMDSTPWPETVDDGVNTLAPPSTETDWSQPISYALNRKRRDGIWDGFGDGHTGEKIAQLLKRHLQTG